MTDEITPVPVVEPEFKTTLTPEQLEAALGAVEDRSFAGRNPEYGKMKKCQVCGLRHRESDVSVKMLRTEEDGVVTKMRETMIVRPACVQKFTDVFKGKDGRKYHQYHEEEKDGETIVTLEHRTATPYGEKPTMKQIVGAAQFNKKRFHPHPSKIKLLFIERVRRVFERLGFELENENKEQFQKDLHRSRIVAARELRKERRAASRRVRLEQRASRRINRGE